MTLAQGKGNVISRTAPLDMNHDEFRALAYRLVDNIADLLNGLPDRPVAPGKSTSTVRAALQQLNLPLHGSDPEALLDEAVSLLFNHSTFNGHPRFLGYITSSAAPLGALGDFLAAAVNPNVGAWPLSPMASEIEAQTVRWIAELIGYPTECGGLLVSGGNMANFVGLLVAHRAKAAWDVRSDGMAANPGGAMRIYASADTHTWLQKAADLFGLGLNSLRWIPTDSRQRMDTAALRSAISADKDAGDTPFLVVGTAGSVMTGAVDPLRELSSICREYGIWFHVDGAYGGFAAALPDAPADLLAILEADSVAVDPHKWLYSPLEAGCALVRDSALLRNAFSFHPPYYMFEDSEDVHIDYHEYGPQNSRGFRALKVWLGLRQAGRDGYIQMISDDIEIARHLHHLVDTHPLLEAWTQDLSITTFRFLPVDLRPGEEATDVYLNALNEEVLLDLQTGGEVFLSNAIVNGVFLLRACVVNFRTSKADMEAITEIVVRVGSAVDTRLRAQYFPNRTEFNARFSGFHPLPIEP